MIKTYELLKDMNSSLAQEWVCTAKQKASFRICIGDHFNSCCLTVNAKRKHNKSDPGIECTESQASVTYTLKVTATKK